MAWPISGSQMTPCYYIDNKHVTQEMSEQTRRRYHQLEYENNILKSDCAILRLKLESCLCRELWSFLLHWKWLPELWNLMITYLDKKQYQELNLKLKIANYYEIHPRPMVFAPKAISNLKTSDLSKKLEHSPSARELVLGAHIP
jgi:hypothetical protein